MRLTCRDCLEHSYIAETMPGNIPPGPQVPLQISTEFLVVKTAPSMTSVSPRSVPPSHAHSPANNKPAFNGSLHPHRRPFYPQSTEHNGVVPSAPSPDLLDALQIQNDSSVSSHHSAAPSSVYTGANHIQGTWNDGNAQQPQYGQGDAMDVSPSSPPDAHGQLSEPQPMEVSPSAPEPPKRLPVSEQPPVVIQPPVQQPASNSKLGLFRRPGRLGRLMFGNAEKGQQPVLPPVDELNVASSSSTPSLKRTQTSSTDSHVASDMSSIGEPIVVEPPPPPVDAKTRKKEAERIALEAEKARRALAEKRSREQARAVMQKRNQILKQKHGSDFDWDSANATQLLGVQKPKSKQRSNIAQASSSSATINAAGGRFRGANEAPNPSDYDNFREAEHRTKARRRDLDDDHSMSSSDLQSVGRLSVMSFATVESDPVSAHLRHRPSLFGITRMQSASSLRTSFGDDFSASARSSNSPSFEQQLVSDFDSRASMSSYDAARSSMSEASSPLPMHSLSLSSPQQQQAHLMTRHPFITLPPVQHQPFRAPTPGSPYEYGQYGQIQAQPPSPAIAPHSAINPIFKVVSKESVCCIRVIS